MVGGGSGNDVPVSVGDFLASCGAVIDGDGCGWGVRCGFDGGNDMVDGFHECFGGVGWEVVEAFVVISGDDECVTRGQWVSVEERMGRFGCVDGSAGAFSVHDLTKHTRHSGGLWEGTEIDWWSWVGFWGVLSK